MKAKDIRGLRLEELKAREREVAEQIFKFRLEMATSQQANPMRLRNLKRDLARIKTIIRTKKE